MPKKTKWWKLLWTEEHLLQRPSQRLRTISVGSGEIWRWQETFRLFFFHPWRQTRQCFHTWTTVPASWNSVDILPKALLKPCSLCTKFHLHHIYIWVCNYKALAHVLTDRRYTKNLHHTPWRLKLTSKRLCTNGLQNCVLRFLHTNHRTLQHSPSA